jgi:hypothetical protein
MNNLLGKQIEHLKINELKLGETLQKALITILLLFQKYCPDLYCPDNVSVIDWIIQH